MELINAVVIDDEERARDSLKGLINNFCKDVRIVGEASNVPDGVTVINKHRPQVVFLDIEMPDYNGFEIVDFFRDVDFEIIFVTAYSEYALKAFEVSAIDYLLKPVDADKLQAAIEKAKKRLNGADMMNKMHLLKDSMNSGSFHKIALPVSEGLIFVTISEIVYLEADGAYTEVWLNNGTRIVVSKKLKFFEDVLENKPFFFRSHRSYIVNINYIEKYNRSENSLKLDNGKIVIISRDRKSEFERQLKENNLTIG